MSKYTYSSSCGVTENKQIRNRLIKLAFSDSEVKSRFEEKFSVEIVFVDYSYFTCSASANIPAANGAEAEVPVCLVVQVFFRSVVACKVVTAVKFIIRNCKVDRTYF